LKGSELLKIIIILIIIIIIINAGPPVFQKRFALKRFRVKSGYFLFY